MTERTLLLCLWDHSIGMSGRNITVGCRTLLGLVALRRPYSGKVHPWSSASGTLVVGQNLLPVGVVTVDKI